MVTGVAKLAEINLTSRFLDNPHRGLVLSLSSGAVPRQFSWVMGRSPNSQNRLYVVQGDILRTEAADPAKVEDPRLIIYNAMKMTRVPPRSFYIVSNGDQTDSVDTMCTSLDSPEAGVAFTYALRSRHCEPDAPTFTPRITGVQESDHLEIAYFSVLKADPFAREAWLTTINTYGLKKDDYRQAGMSESQVTEAFNQAVGEKCGLNHHEFPTIRNFFEVPLHPGFGVCLTTYMPGSKELPSFEGEPFPVVLGEETLEETMQSLWNRLAPEWRVALGGREFHDDEYRMATPINRFEKVQ